MQCVFIGDKLPDGFEEQGLFSVEMPYTVNIKQFSAEDIVPLHYAESLEILLCDGLCGDIAIDTHRFQLEGKQLFAIPPYTVHANNIRPGDGTMYVFKIGFQELGSYINVPNYLSLLGYSIDQLAYRPDAYDAVFSVLQQLIACDGDLPRCLQLILQLFRILADYVDRERNVSALHFRFRGSSLQELIQWTNRNYARKITIDEVAAMTGYSKYHFCSRFKALTGMTYMNYLNCVRVSHACLMLRNGESVQTVCRSTGFENISYFIQVFKRIQHITPYQYASQQKKLVSGDGQ